MAIIEGLQLARSIETRRNPLSRDGRIRDRLVTAHAPVSEESDADPDLIRSAHSGNCAAALGYIPIVEAVLEARAAYRKGNKP